MLISIEFRPADSNVSIVRYSLICFAVAYNNKHSFLERKKVIFPSSGVKKTICVRFRATAVKQTKNSLSGQLGDPKRR